MWSLNASLDDRILTLCPGTGRGLDRLLPKDVELEVELTHLLWVLTCNHFGRAPVDLKKAMTFLEPLLGSLVSKQVVALVKDGLLRRRANTSFTMCHDAGRYMTKENSKMRPPGEVAAMTL